MKNNCIEIYPSVGRLSVYILGCSVFVFLGFFIMGHPRGGTDRYIGLASIVFFSFGVLAGLVWLLSIVLRKPLARIYDDRVEYLIPARMKYGIVEFRHVEAFEVVKMGAKLIRADYLKGGHKDTGIMDALVSVRKVCGMLNDRLENFGCSRGSRSRWGGQ